MTFIEKSQKEKRKFDCENWSVDTTDGNNSINRETNDCPATSTIHLMNLDDTRISSA